MELGEARELNNELVCFVCVCMELHACMYRCAHVA